MPTATRPSSSSGMVGNGSYEQSDSLANFAFLPSELQVHILELACQLPPSAKRPSAPSLSCSDVRITLNLALVCRSWDHIIVRALYAHVKLRSLSALRAFEAALKSRPAQLPQLVRSLYIGPTDDFPEKWWPISLRGIAGESPGGLYFLSSLQAHEAHLLPTWSRPGRRWPLHYDHQPKNCQEHAVFKAARTASTSINVNVNQKQRDRRGQGRYIGQFIWYQRTFELQAVVDLYLCHLGRVDDHCLQMSPTLAAAHSQCRGETCVHYPELVIATRPGAGKVKGDGIIVITRKDIDRHLSRRGATTNRLDHPLVLARTGRRKLGMTSKGSSKAVDRLLRGPVTSTDMLPGQFLGDEDESPDSSDAEGVAGFARLGRDRDSGRVLKKGDMIEVAALCRSILRLTTQVSNLSLTSHVHHVLYGKDAVPQLQTLRSLALGPVTPLWTSLWSRTLDGSNGKLARIEELRVSGIELAVQEATLIANRQAFPQLKRVQWLFTAMSPFVSTLRDLLVCLQGREADVKPGETPGTLLIELHLLPQAAKEVIKLAPSPEHRAAWRQGDLAPGARNRIRIIDCDANVSSKDNTDCDIMRTFMPGMFNTHISDGGYLYKEGVMWWEETAVDRGRARERR